MFIINYKNIYCCFMAKKEDYSVMSHSERKKRSRELNAFDSKGIYAGLEEQVSVESYDVDDTGFVNKKVEVKSVKVSDRNKGLRVADFSIENLSAIGAVGNLKFSQLGGDVDVATSNIDKALDYLDAVDVANESIDNSTSVSE